MFERYSERARRTLFFARYETSELGGSSIAAEHLLLGLMRDARGFMGQLFARAELPLERVRAELASAIAGGEKVSTSVEVPFSEEVKSILEQAAKEADELGSAAVDVEHLLLAILGRDQSLPATLLMKFGIHADAVRAEIVRLRRDHPGLGEGC